MRRRRSRARLLGDPLSDLAQTLLHVRQHDPAGGRALVAAYGVDTDSELQRLYTYEVLHAVQERAWIAGDRPYGWQQSLARLDAFVAERSRPAPVRP